MRVNAFHTKKLALNEWVILFSKSHKISNQKKAPLQMYFKSLPDTIVAEHIHSSLGFAEVKYCWYIGVIRLNHVNRQVIFHIL